MPSLKEQLENARPGETVTFSGRQSVGKIIGLRGTATMPISLEGADASAVLVPEPGYTAAVARFEDCEWFQVGRLKIDGEGRADRALQLFTGSDLYVYDLETRGVPHDHLHIAGCDRVHVHRIKCLGEGGEPMGGGKGPHAVYFTRIDGGGGCANLVAEDVDCTDIAGAAFQANGDGAWLRDVRFTRCRATNYGVLGGSGVNLAQCVAPWLQDIILIPHPLSDNPGVASFDGTTGTVMDRYSIERVDPWSGPMTAEEGEPEEPEGPRGIYGAAPEGPDLPDRPEPEPDEEAAQWCPTCNGVGTQLGPDGGTMPCATCQGTGKVEGPT